METQYSNNERLEITILRNLIFNETFTRKALPFFKDIYFSKNEEKLLFDQIFKFVDKYKNIPTKESLLIELNQRKS